MTKKKIVITGASSGIGRALAMQFASLGHRVIAVARHRKLLETLQQTYPLHIEIIVADITKTVDLDSIQAALSKEERGIFLVHNAGVHGIDTPAT